MPAHSAEELHDRVAINEESTKLIIKNKFIEVEHLNKILKHLEKTKLQGKLPPRLPDYAEEIGLIGSNQKKALEIALERFERDRETSQFKIKGYQLTKKIGSGGLGVVYLAWQKSMHRRVAIKILYDKWADDTEFRNRFILEARVMGRLSHQNLIQVYDVGRESNHLYFAMEYIDGPTVEARIEQEGGMSVLESLDIALQIARSINYISGFDIVHRDIKPANIMLTKNGIAKLGDFGFLLTKHEGKLAQEGYVIGTPDYISPEQASGKTVDFRSDIYSLGVSLYHMITGDLPYHGTASTVMRKHVSGDLPDRIPERGKKIPPEVYSVICKMMAKDPDERYADLSTLMDDLRYLKAVEITKKGSTSTGSSILQKPPSLPKPSFANSDNRELENEMLRNQVDELRRQNRHLFGFLVASLALCALIGLAWLIL